MSFVPVAPIGTPATLFNGLREFGQVTNSYGGYITSAGSAYSLLVPFFVHKFEWYRYTAFGTAGILGQGVWFQGFPTTSSLILQAIVDNGSTGKSSQLLDTTNGITEVVVPSGFVAEQLVISDVTTATPGVVTTTTNHGLNNLDRVVITQVIGTMASVINNNTYVVQVLSATTFALYDTFGFPITLLGAYTSGGQVTKTGPSLGIVDAPTQVSLTLGTSIMGSDADLIYFVAWHFNNYVNLGVA